MDNLDIGVEYNNPRYNIQIKGDFKELVEILGGKYSCGDNKATWTNAGAYGTRVYIIEDLEKILDVTFGIDITNFWVLEENIL